ncbi:MAG: LPS export ABC transporter permease LptG [Alphaproteobacteria bacterium]|nr:LPS export ABC transporter permease LptG [Alphaproteobacteria bacterium]
MKLTTTLSRYLAKEYIINLALLLLALLSVVYLFDTVELIRRASKQTDVPLILVLEMGLFKLPEVGQTILPFAVLFSAMFTFWKLTRRYELIVVRAAGFSVWQFMTPIAIVAILLGILQMTAINPLGAIFISKFEQLEREYLSHQENHIAVFKEGLWLRQAVMIEPSDPTDAQAPLTPGYVILHAQKIKQPEWMLQNVTVFYFTENNDFLQRADAASAILEKGSWLFKNVFIHGAKGETLKEEIYKLPTNLTREDIEESFSSPQSMSFWKLPGYIQTLKETGFDPAKLEIYYQNLLSQPLMLAAMVLLAATVSMRPPRSRGTFMMIMTGVFIGFLVFFMASFLQALGASQQIPVLLAAWSPAAISFLLGLSVMMNIEDG